MRREHDRHGPAARGELDRVAHEVGDDLADPRRIVQDPDRPGRQAQLEPDSAPLGGRLGLLDRRFDRRANVLRTQVQEHEARIELRQLEQVLGQPVEAFELLG